MKKIFDLITYAEEHGISISYGTKRARKGWVQLSCPFCGKEPDYLGYNLAFGYFHCWYCGGKTVKSFLYKVGERNISKALRDYSARISSNNDFEIHTAAKECKLPYGVQEILPHHADYLRSRGFNVEDLTRIWKLKSTGIVGDYKHRIFAPIEYNSMMVSFQCRSIGDIEPRYMACPKSNEVIHHQNFIYGYDLAVNPVVVIVEGMADAWKLGAGSVAVFGSAFTPAQVKVLGKWPVRYIIFDTEKKAQEQAEKMAYMLEAYGGETTVIELDEAPDPGSLSVADAKKIMETLS